jgi:nicotinamidase-related amidase
MSNDLAVILEPGSTAILCMEMQRGVVGELAMPRHRPLGDAVYSAGIPARLAGLMEAGRRAGVQVVYCNAVKRPDHKGAFLNTPMLVQTADLPEFMREGSESVQVIPELRVDPADLVSSRYHGFSPFTETALDIMLRAQGIRTIVATGVSLNRGITAMAFEGVSRGYNVVVARDCVTGLPAEYAAAQLQHGLEAISRILDAAQIQAHWTGQTR